MGLWLWNITWKYHILLLIWYQEWMKMTEGIPIWSDFVSRLPRACCVICEWWNELRQKDIKDVFEMIVDNVFIQVTTGVFCGASILPQLANHLIASRQAIWCIKSMREREKKWHPVCHFLWIFPFKAHIMQSLIEWCIK